MKLLKFYADWCQPCKMLSVVVKDAKDKIGMPVEDVNIDENLFMCQDMNVRGVPTMVVVDDSGAVVRTRSGYMNEEDLLEFINDKKA